MVKSEVKVFPLINLSHSLDNRWFTATSCFPMVFVFSSLSSAFLQHPSVLTIIHATCSHSTRTEAFPFTVTMSFFAPVENPTNNQAGKHKGLEKKQERKLG